MPRPLVGGSVKFENCCKAFPGSAPKFDFGGGGRRPLGDVAPSVAAMVGVNDTPPPLLARSTKAKARWLIVLTSDIKLEEAVASSTIVALPVPLDITSAMHVSQKRAAVAGHDKGRCGGTGSSKAGSKRGGTARLIVIFAFDGGDDRTIALKHVHES